VFFLAFHEGRQWADTDLKDGAGLGRFIVWGQLTHAQLEQRGETERRSSDSLLQSLP
jgi:hypothetical protein